MTSENADGRGSSRPGGTVSLDRVRATEARPRHARYPSRWGYGAALGLTVVGALVPGAAFLAAGRRVLGALTLGVLLLLVGAGVWLGTGGRRTALRAAVDTDVLLWVVGAIAVGAVLWIAVVITGYRMLVPSVSPRRYLLGAVLVAVLVLGVAGVGLAAGRLLLTQRDLIVGVFSDDGESATVTPDANPFGSKDRVNVLLLGGDGGQGREGVRTDTVIVASIDTESGDTTLFSLPRNLEDLPFPEDSPLAEVYPEGFDAGTESESLLNAVYRNGPAQHPEILGPTDNPGADFLKLGVGEALGLDLDYYVLVNLEGFSRLVDALGGVTVNVNYWVPVGGIPDSRTLPDDYLRPGPNQLLNGAQALDFARGRFGLTDYDRMARQRCTLDAIIDAADPGTLLRQYQELASTTQDIVSTDVPRSVLDDFVDLGFLVKDAEVRSVVFDETVISPAYPDYGLMRQLVQDALQPPAPQPAPDDDSPQPTAPAPTDTPAAPQGPATDVADACAYDSARAEEALAAGKPPVRGG